MLNIPAVCSVQPVFLTPNQLIELTLDRVDMVFLFLCSKGSNNKERGIKELMFKCFHTRRFYFRFSVRSHAYMTHNAIDPSSFSMSAANGGRNVDMVYLVLSGRQTGLLSAGFPVGQKSLTSSLLSDSYFMYPYICARQRTRKCPSQS